MVVQEEQKSIRWSHIKQTMPEKRELHINCSYVNTTRMMIVGPIITSGFKWVDVRKSKSILLCIMYMTLWTLWKERYGLVFRGLKRPADRGCEDIISSLFNCINHRSKNVVWDFSPCIQLAGGLLAFFNAMSLSKKVSKWV
ncbi:hypothetical protein HanRHA438_Chr05g0215661 [Helianthus annuus]|nr:hypothetical protein HanHA300_Chr05g0169041 [Helianthus annuus]KAJ0583989.1 hypothetical protein HanHA89_Chr05g0183141 [Helianthus annuus]KAJ0918254.1 hypothetical protein HanRHA438_Chr05g0215661 [Helianthus annuus]